MKTLDIDLESCYGIRKLKKVIEFGDKQTFAIYAPNGMMKSSFAQTFQDLASGIESKDRIFASRKCKRVVKDEANNELKPEEVYVIKPYDEELGHTEKTSTLLVDSKLRKEYEQLHEEVDIAKELLLKALKEQTGTKKNIELEISDTFTRSKNKFIIALTRIREEIEQIKDNVLSEIRYDIIFDDKVVSFLETKDFKTAIKDYIAKYNELIEKSIYFKKGVFNYYNATTIAKNLADNGFFEAKHTISLNAKDKREITTQEELVQLIDEEKKKITEDAVLKKKFADIEKPLYKNAALREFSEYLANNMHLLPHLANLEEFREQLWKGYLKAREDLYLALLEKYKAVEKRKNEIEKEAAKQRTQWENVIELFNNKFYVPFRLEAVNRTAVILGQEEMLSLGFTFDDGLETAKVERSELLRVLSTGEKKALYILNIIFEVEARKKTGQKTLFVIDDIADSFDYKNKYAIIEYLKEIADESNFYMVVLTHNFDFFRTINSRDIVAYKNCYMAIKAGQEIVLERAAGIKNVFVYDWKQAFYTDAKKRIACIPFIRNIIEYTKGEEDPDYQLLTSLLHWKTNTATITQGELGIVYRNVFGGVSQPMNEGDKVVDVLLRETQTCLQAHEGVNFENKIILAMAIRLEAEKYMISKINDDAFINSIGANQTSKLVKRLRKTYADTSVEMQTMKRVMLMTPESIHLNSFMYEPILDMSDEHLRQLYSDVKALQ